MDDTALIAEVGRRDCGGLLGRNVKYHLAMKRAVLKHDE
jgi:hypothetical protein